MASHGQLWFMQPIQVFTTLGAAINFGGSVLQSPLIMPMLKQPKVPAHYQAKNIAFLVHESEKFFPPLNALCTLGNLVLTGACYVYSRPTSGVISALDHTQREALAKLPRLALSFGLNVATTAWALLIMVPMNRRMSALAAEMEILVKKGEEHSGAMAAKERELREVQGRWQVLNYGRATIMIGASLAGMSALLVAA